MTNLDLNHTTASTKSEGSFDITLLTPRFIVNATAKALISIKVLP